MQLFVRNLTPESFFTYGMVIGQPASAAEASGPGWQWWSEVAVIPSRGEPYAVGYLNLVPQPLQFDWAEHHVESPEVIIPVGDDCLVYVGPPGQTPVWESFEVFRVRPGQAVMLHEGVWHGAPLALDQPTNALVLLKEGTGTRDVQVSKRNDGPVHVTLSSGEN